MIMIETEPAGAILYGLVIKALKTAHAVLGSGKAIQALQRETGVYASSPRYS